MTAILRNTKIEKLCLLIFFISATLGSLKAQTWKTPMQASGSKHINLGLKDVYFTSAIQAWDVGNSGTILITNN